ncbi:MAG: DUF1501 domain-containing protein [Pirellulales bacterium]
MLTFLGRKQSFCDGVSRRDFLRVGALSVGGLSLPEVLRLRAEAGTANRAAGKSVIMIYLPGGPPHMDMYDMKPNAAREFRGELNPISTNVSGMEICELMPRQAKIADKLAIINGIKFVDEHSAHMVMTGFPDRVKRPAFGAVVSHLHGRGHGLPPSVSLMNNTQAEDPAYCGPAHRPFVPSGPGLDNLSLAQGVTVDRLTNRKELLSRLDNIRREVDYGGALAGIDAFTSRALDMVTSKDARAAFDVEKEPEAVRQKYGRENRNFLLARRLVEAGVSVVTLATGGWDTHGDNFNQMRRQLPQLDQGIHALVTDLVERGMDKDVAVVMWGEFGRTPRINSGAGRDHWAPAGSALLACGNFRLGQVIGKTDARGERSVDGNLAPSNVLSTLYHHMGIDASAVIRDNNGRPMYLLDDREPIRELI